MFSKFLLGIVILCFFFFGFFVTLIMPNNVSIEQEKSVFVPIQEKVFFSLNPPICAKSYEINNNNTVSFFSSNKKFLGTGFIGKDKQVLVYAVKNQAGEC